MIQFLFQGKTTLPRTIITFMALVDSIVPNTPGLTNKKAATNAVGALDLHIDEYQISILNHYVALKIIFKNYNIYLANATAAMLNRAAGQLISRGENTKPVNPVVVSEKGAFAALEATDRCRALTLLEGLQADLANLPIPFRNNPGMVLAMVSILTMLTTSGYYSEWPAYGTTCLKLPEKESKIGQTPAGWKQVEYSGPSKGYHALRGQLVDKFTE
jgi:hypothetical protein